MAAAVAAKTFPLVEVRGGPAERGAAHGEALRERIERTLAFYLEDLFAGSALTPEALAALGARSRQLTQHYAPAIAEEIEGIAHGSALQPWQLFLLNARTEVLNARVNECSALYFAESRVLAQNWDWVEQLEDLVVVMRHLHNDGSRHIAFCEPGMVAKIGMNSRGIGVCLNILFAPHDLSGLPVHILIGALLHAQNFAQARAILSQAGHGKASHLLVADAEGMGVSFEYFGDESHAFEPRDGVLLHTNHCLGRGARGRSPDLANSCARYDLLQRQVAASRDRSMARAKAILLDKVGGEYALMREYKTQNVLGTHRVGTCASIIMELDEGRFHIRRGPGSSDEFATIVV